MQYDNICFWSNIQNESFAYLFDENGKVQVHPGLCCVDQNLLYQSLPNL